MSLYKHPKSPYWYVRFTTPSGERIKRSTGTHDRQAAQEYHDRLKADLWRQKRLGDKPKRMFDEAALEYLKSLEGRSNYRNAVHHIKHWAEHFSGQTLCSLTTDAIEMACPTHKMLNSGERVPIQPATKNRFLATLSKMLNDAKRRGWVETVPYIRKHREDNKRELFLTRNEARKFINSLPIGWMRDVCEFALSTGMRAGEILSLEWAQVDVERAFVSVLASKAKSGKGRGVPLNETALSVIRRRKGHHEKFVFARAGKQTYEIDRRVFARAVEAAGVDPSFRFHDLRHTWASWMAQSGVSTHVLMKLGGWSSLTMLDRYAHLSVDDLAQYAKNVELCAHQPSQMCQDFGKILPMTKVSG